MDEATELLQRLQAIIEEKDAEIKKLRSRVYTLKAYNERLRKSHSEENCCSDCEPLPTVTPPPIPAKKIAAVADPSKDSATKEKVSNSASQSPRPKHRNNNPEETGSPVFRSSKDKVTPPGSGTPPILGSIGRRSKLTGRLSNEDCSEIANRQTPTRSTQASHSPNIPGPTPTTSTTTGTSSNSTSSSITTTTDPGSASSTFTAPELRGDEQLEDIDAMSITSSDFSSTEDSSIDLDVSSVSPTSPTSVISNLPDTPNIKPLRGRRAMSSGASQLKKHLANGKNQENEGEEANKLTLSLPPFRSRMSTYGGQSLKPITRNKKLMRSATKDEGDGDKDTEKIGSPKSSKLHRSNSYPLLGQHSSAAYNRDLLSTDMEMKIQQIILIALEKKYGGKEKATKAATIIQTAYRRYKTVQQFKLLRERQQTTMQRRRTMSVKYPGGRRPSMIKRKPKTINGGSGAIDKMAQVKTVYKSLTQPKLSPNISRRELHTTTSSPLSTATMTVQSPLENGASAMMNDLPNEFSTTGQHLGNQLSMIDEIEDDDEAVSELEKTYHQDQENDGRSQRASSIFSGLSSTTIQKMFNANHPVIVQQRESASTLRRKTVIGANIFNRNPKRGIQYLVFEGVLEDSPQAVADFLKSYYAISKEKIGEFVGEIRHEFNVAVLECLVESIDFEGKNIDDAIRDFQKLFRMPGEAQKIDKIMEVFASEYYKHNENDIVKSEDAAYVLSFAIMMLHTDLHNPSVKRHMTKQEWLKMNRGTNDDENFPDSFLLSIYDRISQKEFETGKDHTHQVSEIRKKITGHGIPPLANPQRRFIHQCDVSQVKDMNKKDRRRHRRTLFLFNDVVLITKQTALDKYEFRNAFTLLNAQAMNFNTQYYKYGVYLQQEMSGETYYCNLETEGDRTRLLTRLSESISELREMENERISDFAYKGKNTTMPNKSQTMKRTDTSAGDLITSITVSSSEQNLSSVASGGKNDTRRGSKSKQKDKSKRSSKDSGFDSPQTVSPTPYATSTLPNHSNLLSPRSINGMDRGRSLSPEPSTHSPEHSSKKMIVIPTSDPSSPVLEIAKAKTLARSSSSPQNKKAKVGSRKSVPVELQKSPNKGKGKSRT